MQTTTQQFFEVLRKTQFLPPANMLEYQRGLLEKLLRHARAHVPFYRDTGRLAPLFRDDDSIDWTYWPRIPLLTRKELQEQYGSLRSDVVPAAFGNGRQQLCCRLKNWKSTLRACSRCGTPV